MDWSVLHALNDFLFRHDGVEDPLLFYVNASEALFVATLVIVFLAAHGRRHLEWRRTVPVRSRIDALADLLGGCWDRALEWGAGRIGVSRRA